MLTVGSPAASETSHSLLASSRLRLSHHTERPLFYSQACGVQHPETHEKPLAGMHILVDAGNGAGGFFATRVLQQLGADITGSQFLDPDGSFPNHVPNPEDPAAMAATIDAVKANGADMGIVFDTDVDRSGLVDAAGRAINKNKLIALMSAVTLRKFPGSTIVTDSVTSSGLSKFITKLGGTHYKCVSLRVFFTISFILASGLFLFTGFCFAFSFSF